MPAIDWQPWATESFQRARRGRLPVLLLLSADWAPACRDLEHRLQQDATLALIAKRFVPVRVDVDWRPDIADRYGLGDWPTLLALTPEGHVLAGGLPTERDLADWLRDTADAFARHDGSFVPAAPQIAPGVPAEDGPDVRAETWQALAAAIDPLTGAFGAARQPAIAPALAGFAGAAAGMAAYLESAECTIDVLLDSPRWDAGAGLLRIRGERASEPGAHVARLDEQADWIRLLVHATRWTSRPRWEAALDVAVRGLRTAFGGPGPSWRPWTGGPDVVMTEPTARACRALLLVAVARDQPACARDAIATLEAVLPRVYTRGAGLSHVFSTRPHGPALLLDAMITAHALLDADAWRDDPVYRDLAHELLLNAEARLLQPAGALADRRHTMAGANDVGRLSDVLMPIEGNAEAARLSLRLSGGQPGATDDLADRASRLLRAIHHDVRHAGGFAAPAALAWAAHDAPDSAVSVW